MKLGKRRVNSPLWSRRNGEKEAAAAARAVQTATAGHHPYDLWMGYTPLTPPEWRLYRSMRESVPIIDAALDKIVRLTGGFRVECAGGGCQRELDGFVEGIRVGPSSVGLHQFVSVYLDSLLTYGNAVGELVLDGGGEVCALYNACLEDILLRRGKTPLDVEICVRGPGGQPRPVRYSDLVLFTPLNPQAGEIRGESLLRSLPFVTSILLKIYDSMGTNFQRVANLRYAVTYRPGQDRVDGVRAREIADSIAREWSDAMSSAKSGVIKDFVAVGDVDVKVIGADNQMLDTEVPVRQMLEQIVAKLGIPPFMLGLHWSSTERMSSQQADILTSELESYRRLMESVILRICGLFLRTRGRTDRLKVHWDDINLQDELEAANARLLAARARELEHGETDRGESV